MFYSCCSKCPVNMYWKKNKKIDYSLIVFWLKSIDSNNFIKLTYNINLFQIFIHTSWHRPQGEMFNIWRNPDTKLEI